MLLVVSATVTSHEHSLHDFFQTYLSDSLRHWFSDCNGPRHRTPSLPQIMLMHIMRRPCVPFFCINMTYTCLDRGREGAGVSCFGCELTPQRVKQWSEWWWWLGGLGGYEINLLLFVPLYVLWSNTWLIAHSENVHFTVNYTAQNTSSTEMATPALCWSTLRLKFPVFKSMVRAVWPLISL